MGHAGVLEAGRVGARVEPGPYEPFGTQKARLLSPMITAANPEYTILFTSSAFLN